MKNEALDYLAWYKTKTQGVLDEFLNSKLTVAQRKGDSHVKAVEAFVDISGGGKRLRGSLMYLGYLFGGGEENDKARRTTLMSEVLHVGLLVQDDVFDRDNMRRGVATIHTKFEPSRYGDAMAIMIGDLAFSWALELLVTSDLSSDVVVEMLELYTSYFENVVWGQMSDVSAGFSSTDLMELEVLEIMKSKTAQYSAVMPLHMGLVMAGSKDVTLLKAVKLYGLNLGLAFQIQDDILGIFGTEDIGKPVGGDISEAKQTLMVVHFRLNASREDINKLEKVWGKVDLDKDDLVLVRELFRKNGSYKYAKERAGEYVLLAREVVDEITTNKHHIEILNDLLDYIIVRLN